MCDPGALAEREVSARIGAGNRRGVTFGEENMEPPEGIEPPTFSSLRLAEYQPCEFVEVLRDCLFHGRPFVAVQANTPGFRTVCISKVESSLLEPWCQQGPLV
jgi:hypothetical protein